MLARIFLVLGTILLPMPSGLCAQGISIIEYGDVQVATLLSGIVHDPADSPMAGVLVEEFDSNWKSPLRSAMTDEQGRFTMATVKGRKIYFLQFSFRYCNPIRMRVKIDARHGKQLQVKMVNST